MNLETMRDDAFKTIDEMGHEESKQALRCMYLLSTTHNPGDIEQFKEQKGLMTLIVNAMLAMLMATLNHKDDKIKELEQKAKDPLGMDNLKPRF